jgi:hypothetical protein
MKKKVDSRVRTLIENNVKTRHRSMFVLVGDKGRDQVRAAGAEASRRTSGRGGRVRTSYTHPPPSPAPPLRRRRRRRGGWCGRATRCD